MPELMNAGETDLDFSEVVKYLDPLEIRDETKFHVSTLVNEAAQLNDWRDPTSGKNQWYDPNAPDVPAFTSLANMGRVAEHMFRPIVQQLVTMGGYQFLPQKICDKQEIIGTLDGLIYKEDIEEPFAVVEMKSKWAQPYDPRTNPKWMSQVMAYLYMQENECTRAWMPIMFLPRPNQDSNWVTHIQTFLFKLEFTPAELKSNWNLLLNARDALVDQYKNEREEEIA